MRAKRYLLFCSILSLSALQFPSQAQDPSKQSSSSGQKETVAKPLTEKQKRAQQKKLEKELETPYKRWLNEEVTYIITDEERKAFTRLQTDEEREQFIEQFWLRRDPTPDTEENEFREEHYRRIAYANENYASGIPGWKTDRGMIYIKYGAPDENESHPSGGSYERPIEEGGGETSTYPFEKWRYRYIEGIGNNVVIEFVDTTMTGEYHIATDPEEKDALLYVPNAGLTLMEQMGLADKTQRFTRTDGTHLGTGTQPLPESMNEFTRIETYAKLQAPPAVKYKDLESLVTSTVKFNTLPMQVRADYIPLTGSSVLVNITLLFDRKDLNFKEKDGVSTASVHLYGRVTSISRRPVTWFEEDISSPFPTELMAEEVKTKSIYQRTLPMKPGRYRLSIAAKDMVGGNQTTYEMPLEVPRLDDDTLSTSSLILADQIENVATKSIGTGQFVIGSSKVRPRVDGIYKRDEKLGFYLQVYNFEPDETTHKADGTVSYQIYKAGTTQQVWEFSEPTTVLGGSPSEVIIKKILPLKDLAPGTYTLKIKVVDTKRNQTVTPTANFTVI